MDRAELPELTPDEVAALRRAGAWYASYHATRIAAQAGERHAYAVTRREEYLALNAALRKLGVRIPLPDGLAPAPAPYGERPAVLQVASG